NRISYRLYFRKEYGANRFTPGIFSPATDPLKRLVVHVDWPHDKPFTTCLAFDISRRLGCVVPEVKPAMLYLNGKPQGMFFLSEHLGERQWQAHFNHNKFLFYKYRSSADPESRRRFAELEAWSKNADAPLTMSEVAARVDIDNFSRNLFSYVFCGTDDWIQGVAALDLKKPDSRWFWINWDMDRSFWFQHGSRAGVKAENTWEKYAFEFVLNPRGKNVRTVLFRRLLSESPEYREYFVRLVTDLMNHAINEEFLLSRVDHYRRLAVSYGRKNLKSLNMMSRFCRFRPDYIRRQMRDYFNLGEAFICRIAGENDIKLEIDGYSAKADYQGWYFNGQSVEVRIVDPMGGKFSHWLVNGKRVPDPVLRCTIESETTIEPVFSHLP
ncbi:MAG: CotH kinase family protein, partial [Candidatus Aminicenantes bacterium]|nr:CotH kinase family protein [Candidatus Aminicenantes bacterium]